jgi:hypothetical protein
MSSNNAKEIVDGIVSRQSLSIAELRPFWHEAGHEVLIYAHGLELDSGSRDAAIVVGSDRGATIHKNASPKISATIAWAGVAATAMAGLEDPDVPTPPGVKLTAKNARRCFDYFLAHGGLDKMSRSDRMAIKAFQLPEAFPDKAFQAFERAVEILESRWAIVEHTAAALERDCGDIVRASRLDPEASRRAFQMWIDTGSHKAALLAAKGEKAMADFLRASEVAEASEREPMWITAIAPKHLR